MKTRIYFYFALVAIIFNSCDDGIGLFPSKKKIKHDIRHTWELVPLTTVEHPGEGQLWTFTDKDSILISFNKYDSVSHSIVTVNDKGVYSISTDWNSAFVHISGLSEGRSISEKLNTKWDIVQLDNVLYLAAKPDNSGVQQREFLKQ